MTSAGSLPAWLAERWLARLGPEQAVARAQALAGPAPTVVRLNPRRPEARERLAALDVELQETRVPGAWAVQRGEVSALHREGLLYIQDAGSQLVARLAAEGGGPLLDACAAPGGKSTLAADLLTGQPVFAAEASPRRLRRLAALVRGWGSPNLHVLGADALTPPFRASFATVLLDAPCSGLGTLARHPDIRWRSRAEELERHARRQTRLLQQLCAFVRTGGRLVYAVCSLEPEETTQIVARFLEANRDFRTVPVPSWAAAFAAGEHVATGSLW
jgi:16S rRNA (cytosine967-C5)-methyltransferase